MRDETFSIPFEMLVRRVVPKRGTPYEHTCTKQVYDDVAFAIEELGAGTFTGEEIRAAIGAPFTQVMVAMAFLKERGCIEPVHGRRHRAASDFVYEDALIEWHALREGSPGSAAARGEEA
ncbi:MAG: hypothetical protein KF724_12455 [Phycisphaeraceae bacterium]|nr:hypothetical protein [Phycisphaeraceae bacterium]